MMVEIASADIPMVAKSLTAKPVVDSVTAAVMISGGRELDCSTRSNIEGVGLVCGWLADTRGVVQLWIGPGVPPPSWDTYMTIWP